MSHVLVHPTTGQILLQPGDALVDGRRVQSIIRDNMGQVIIVTTSGHQMRPSPTYIGRRFL